jgi:hypothetical protein
MDEVLAIALDGEIRPLTGDATKLEGTAPEPLAPVQ